MKKLRILLLTSKDLVPPDDAGQQDYTCQPWKTEYDVLVTLRELGHEVKPLGVTRELATIEAICREWRPHIAFNMLEDVYGVIPYDHNMVAYLELLGLAYTGCNPLGLLLSRDKALTKELMTHHRVRVPKFIVCRRGRQVRRPKRLEFPLIAKSLIEDASTGISLRSVVSDDAALAERVAFVHETTDTDAIVEQFIPGREFYVGVMGNQRLDVLPPWELIIEHKPEGMPFLATRKVKWDMAYQKKLSVKTCLAVDLPEGVASHITRVTRRICRILHLSGYARLDFRLDDEGRLYLLEANANPQLGYGEDFTESAEHVGLSYERLIQRIVNLGLRWKAAHEII